LALRSPSSAKGERFSPAKMVTEMVAALYDVSAQETLRTDAYVVTLQKPNRFQTGSVHFR
jgi:hypothetical protein